MKVTVLEVRQRQFQTVMRGYDRAEVNTFLAEVADDFERIALENERLKQEAGKVEAVLNEHRGHEKNLSNALLAAQKLADEIKERAEQDAARLIADGEARAAALVQNSHTRLEEVQREIEALRTKRREVEASLQGIITTLQTTIAAVRDQDLPRRDEKATVPTVPTPWTPAAVSTALVRNEAETISS